MLLLKVRLVSLVLLEGDSILHINVPSCIKLNSNYTPSICAGMTIYGHIESEGDMQWFLECFQRPTKVINRAFGVASFIPNN